MPRVKIAKILPRISLAELFSRKKCYLGISMDNPIFEGEALKAMLLWAEQNFEQTLVIVGDYLCRFNERIMAGCNEKEAGELSIEIGDLFFSKTKGLFAEFDAEKIRLSRWREHLRGEEFQRAKKILDEFFKTNEEFRAAVEYDAVSFVKRQKKHERDLAVGKEEAIRLSSQYILEETAVFSSLAERGWTVELYPGPELRVLAEAAKGRYPGLPKGLADRINVELKISP
ncbi:MAG: tRNA-dependent cyclodipeptide synthase [Sedimentisphaerales bacterium]|nr:tRNA-dependent cyclodipeptide synthase [Sedimentisphaerales bacterium]